MSAIGWYATLLFSYKRVYFQEYPDLRSLPEIPPPESVTISRLREADLADLLRLNGQYNQGVFRTSDDVTAALAMGHRCYVGRGGGDLLGFLWIATREVTSRDLNCRFLLDTDQIVSYHNFVKPDSRGRGVTSSLKALAFREFATEGYRRCYSYVLSTNESSILSARKLSARRVGELVCGYIMGYYFFRVRTVKDFAVKAEVLGGPWFLWKRFLANRGIGRYSSSGAR